MKIKALLLTLLFPLSFLLAQSPFSVYTRMGCVSTDFSDLNNQLTQYNVSEMESEVMSFGLGVQYQIPNTFLASSLDISVIEACPPHTDDMTTMVQMTGFNARFSQAYHVIDKNGWLFYPTASLVYQKSCLNVDGEVSLTNRDDALVTEVPEAVDAPISFSDEICTKGLYYDLGAGFEKGLDVSVLRFYFGGTINYRQNITNFSQTNSGDHINLGNTKLGGTVFEFKMRMEFGY